MFTFKRRAATQKKLNKIQAIHSFYQQRANLKNALSLTLKKQCKNFSSTPEKNVSRTEKVDGLTQLACPSLLKQKKASFQKLLLNRKILNQRGRKIHQMQSKHRLKMIALQQYHKNRRKENKQYLQHNSGAVKVKIGKNIYKSDISCRGLSFQISQTGCDQQTSNTKKLKRIRNDCMRLTQPFNKYKTIQTMPHFTQDIDIKLCPWEGD